MPQPALCVCVLYTRAAANRAWAGNHNTLSTLTSHIHTLQLWTALERLSQVTSALSANVVP